MDFRINLNSYMNRLNNKIMPGIDFTRLDESCNGADTGYAKEVLKQLHDEFVEVYGDYDIQVGDATEAYIAAPAVLQSQGTGHRGIGLVVLSLCDAGEHCGTIFFTPLGTIDDGAEEQENPTGAKQYLKDTYGPYEYWYTPYVQRDIHVDYDNVPDHIADILNHANHAYEEPPQDQTPGMEL